MKKLFYGLAALALAGLFFAACHTGDKEEGEPKYSYKLGTFEGLSAETEWQILNDYYDTYIKPFPQDKTKLRDYYVSHYYGTYNGCVVLHITHDGPNWHINDYVDYNIAGIFVFFHPARDPIAWKDGHFFKLPQVYNEGFMTLDDILSMEGLLTLDDIERYEEEGLE